MTEDKNTAIDKALIILKLFAPSNRELGTTEVSKILGFHRATVSRILLTLTRHGFLRQDPVRKTFTLGSAFVQISDSHEQYLKNNIIQIAKPHIDALSHALQEAVLLELLTDGATIMAYVMEGKRSVPFAAPTGGILDPGSAGSKAIFAFMDDEPWQEAFEQGIRKRTKKTVTSAKTYRKVLKEIRDCGYAIDSGELDEKVAAVSVPIFNHRGEPVAAVNIVGPLPRLDKLAQPRNIEELKKAARKISLELGWSGED